MKRSICSVLTAATLLPFALPSESFARPMRVAARQTVSVDADEQDSVDELPSRSKKQKRQAHESAWYLRLQQAPFIGLAAVSDTGVLDVELMKSVNKYFWVGPTVVAHFDKSGDTKMQSYNLGVRVDVVLPEFGNIDEGLYVSSAILFGAFKSRTYTEVAAVKGTGSGTDYTVSCDFKAEGLHRAGAMVIGKQFHLDESIHLTAGLGLVQSKVFSDKKSGFCEDRSVVNSEGRSLPWLDLGVGFKL